LEFAQAYGAKVEGSGVAFLQMIRSVEEASEEDAVGEGKHMGDLMGQDLATPPQQNLSIVLLPSLAVKGRIIPGEAKNPNPLP